MWHQSNVAIKGRRKCLHVCVVCACTYSNFSSKGALINSIIQQHDFERMTLLFPYISWYKACVTSEFLNSHYFLRTRSALSTIHSQWSMRCFCLFHLGNVIEVWTDAVSTLLQATLYLLLNINSHPSLCHWSSPVDRILMTYTHR